MKRRIVQLLLLVMTAMITTRCSDDEKPKTTPVVTTAAVTDVTTTSATVGGEITDDGNAEITVAGIVYSSAVSIPTIADDKIELTDTEGDFSTLLEGLTSGTLYHVRAYATNSIGIAYGEVVDFTTGNAAPVAINVSVTGPTEVNGTLTATYTYNDSEGNAQSGSTFQWYVADNATGGGEAAIAGATTLTYIIQPTQQTKYIRFGVIPKAATGNTTGVEVKSAFVGAIGEATTVTFMYNGVSVTYGILNSTATGRKWLDRNLGASAMATAVDNYQNYGDLFQWGRLADGHQRIIRNGPTDADMVAVNGPASPPGGGPPYPLSPSDVPPNSLFIIIPNGQSTVDWRDPQNNNLWQGVNGTNNPCPAGWRIPTNTEWANEGLTNIGDGYIKLKLTNTSLRSGLDASFSLSTAGRYWSSSIGTTDPTTSIRIGMNATVFGTLETIRANGLACRCIKD